MTVTVEQLRSWTTSGSASADGATALRDVIAIYSAQPSAPLSLHARTKKLDAKAYRALDVLRVPAMRASLHLLPRDTAHLGFRAVPEPPALSARRLKTFGLSDARYAAFATTREPPRDTVDLLPKWDAYTMGLAPDGRAPFAEPNVVDRLYEKSGDGRPVVLVNGAAAGVWSVTAGKGKDDLVIDVELFDGKPAKKLQARLDGRVEAVRAFLA
jgi:hypothetical protein